jgi:hypothetical protein
MKEVHGIGPRWRIMPAPVDALAGCTVGGKPTLAPVGSFGQQQICGFAKARARLGLSWAHKIARAISADAISFALQPIVHCCDRRGEAHAIGPVAVFDCVRGGRRGVV